jgi:hypothetical protein
MQRMGLAGKAEQGTFRFIIMTDISKTKLYGFGHGLSHDDAANTAQQSIAAFQLQRQLFT